MRKIQIFAMVALATIFAGCSNNDDEVMKPKESLKDTPINVNVLMTDIQTRAGYDSSSQPDKFYLSIDQDGTSYDYTNVVMKYEESKWVAYESDATDAPKKQLLWEGSDVNVTVTAATFSLASGSSYSLSAQTDQTTAYNVKASDHLYYYSNTVTPSTNGISIPFDHIMSKIEITVKLRTEYEDATDNPITSVSVFGSKVSGTYNPTVSDPNTEVSNSTWNPSGNTSEIAACPAGTYTELAATYEVILIPQSLTANTFSVEILIGDKTYKWTSTEAVNLEKGKKYTLELNVGKDKVSGNNFTAAAWGAEENINNKTE